jgi:hypothetical protein
VKLEFLDGQGNVLRTYSSSDPVPSPSPATDPVAYNKLCQQTPNAPDCALPLYWPAPPQVLKTAAGMHRFTWDMHYEPQPGTRGRGFGEAGAVPHRTYPSVNSPWVAPGVYSVRLTADGKTQTQPIAIKLDPRVKITPDVQQIFTLTTRMESEARNVAGARTEALAMIEKVKAGPQANDALLKKLQEMAPPEPPAPAGGGGFGGFGPPAEPAAVAPTLTNMGGQLIAAVMGMQSSEMPPTAAQLAACKKQEAAYMGLMAKWSALKAAK